MRARFCGVHDTYVVAYTKKRAQLCRRYNYGPVMRAAIVYFGLICLLPLDGFNKVGCEGEGVFVGQIKTTPLCTLCSVTAHTQIVSEIKSCVHAILGIINSTNRRAHKQAL